MSRKTDNTGISTVVGLILVLGLIVSVAAVIKVAYIPDMKKQLEADHMQSVAADIQDFGNQLELDQAAGAATGAGYTASVSVEMGGGAIPGIDPSASTGTLSLDPAYGQLTITAYDYYDPSHHQLDLGSATAMGRLVYQSNNRYYPDQNISYECGMIVLSQPGGSVMLSPPPLAVCADPNVPERPIVSFNALRLNGTPRSFSSSGTGTIRTWLIPGSTAFASTNVTNVTFTIVSDYASQWYSYLSNMLATSGLDASNYALSRPDAKTVVLRISGTGTYSTGLYLADSSFGTAMGYEYKPPGTATPAPALSAVSSSVNATKITNGTGGMKIYTLEVSLTIANNGPEQAGSVLATCVPPADVGGEGPTNIVLISKPSSNPVDIPAGGSATFTWTYRLDKKQSVKPISFSLSAQGNNTNAVMTTATYS